MSLHAETFREKIARSAKESFVRVGPPDCAACYAPLPDRVIHFCRTCWGYLPENEKIAFTSCPLRRDPAIRAKRAKCARIINSARAQMVEATEVKIDIRGPKFLVDQTVAALGREP